MKLIREEEIANIKRSWRSDRLNGVLSILGGIRPRASRLG